MKFSTYQPAVEPTVMRPPAVHVSGDVNAYGDTKAGAGLNQLAGAIGQVNAVLAKRQDDMDAASVMEARQKIMTSVTEQLYGEGGLFQTAQGENAKGLTQRTTDTIKKTFADIAKNYNGRVQYALKGNLNENMANFQRIAASREMQEYESTQKADYESNITNSAQLAGLTYNVKDALQNYVNDALRLIDARGAQQGWTGAQLQTERMRGITSIVASAVGAAIDNEDYDTAGAYLSQYRKDMDQPTYAKFSRILKKRNDALQMDKTAENIFGQVYDPNTGQYDRAKMKALVAERRKKSAAGLSPEAVDQGFSSIMGQTMDNGSKGCVEACVKGLQGVSPFWKNEADKGTLWAPTIVSDAQADGNMVVEDYTQGMNIPAGAAIIYYHSGADTSNNENAEHVLVSDGKGGFYGNSSSANRVVHGDNVDIGGGLVPGKIIYEKGGSAYDPEKDRQLEALIDAKVADAQKTKKIERENFMDNLKTAIDSTTNYSDALTMINGQGLSGDEKAAMQSYAMRKFGISSQTGRPKGSGRAGGSGGVTQAKVDSSMKTLRKLDLVLQSGGKPSPGLIIAAQDAANLLDDMNLLPDDILSEARDTYNSEERNSALTTYIEENGTAAAYNKLLISGMNPIAAQIVISKIAQVYWGKDYIYSDSDDEDEETSAEDALGTD